MKMFIIDFLQKVDLLQSLKLLITIISILFFPERIVLRGFSFFEMLGGVVSDFFSAALQDYSTAPERGYYHRELKCHM